VTEEGEPKLLDFGIAKMLDLATDATVTSMRMLTPDYASPEQVTGGRISTATDIYSLGAVLYQLLTGKPAHEFEDRTPEGVACSITMREVTRPSRWSPELKGDLEFILLRSLRKDPQERYATVEQFADDLQAFLEFRTVRARSGNAWYRTRRFVRRYWIPVTAAAVVFATLSVGLYIANRERSRANEEAATAKAVSDFLQRDLLAQASANNQSSPNTKPDPDLKVRTALDRAAARISGNFGKQPLVEAAIRQTIANTYRDLSLYPEAQMQLDHALELRRRVQGEQHPDTLSVMRDLADVYIYEGKFAPAQILHAKVLEMRRRVLGEEHPATLDSMFNLAEAYQRLGQYAEAEPIASKALDVSRRVLGKEHYGTLGAMMALGIIYVRRGKYAQAEALDTSLVELQKRVLGEENPDTLRGLNNLAAVYNREGKFQQAEALRLQVLELQRRVLGAEHSDTLVSMNNLAMTYLAEGKYSQAEPILKEALVLYRRVMGQEHPQTVTLMGWRSGAEYWGRCIPRCGARLDRFRTWKRRDRLRPGRARHSNRGFTLRTGRRPGICVRTLALLAGTGQLARSSQPGGGNLCHRLVPRRARNRIVALARAPLLGRLVFRCGDRSWAGRHGAAAPLWQPRPLPRRSRKRRHPARSLGHPAGSPLAGSCL
jgi:tetratricopeptide (TPR) repeat protein